jgi:PAS domain S-box-containing protein
VASFQRAALPRFDRRALLPELLRQRQPGRARPVVLVLAVALFAIILGLRLAVAAPDDAILVFNVMPIALLSFEAGKRGAVVGTALAVASIGVWSAAQGVDVSPIGYSARASAFILVALLTAFFAERLERAHDAQEALLDLAPESTLGLDIDGNVAIANTAAHEILGYRAGELAGLPVELLMPDFFRELTRSLAIGLGSRERFPVVGRRKDGSELAIEVTPKGLPSDAGVLLLALRPAEPVG